MHLPKSTSNNLIYDPSFQFHLEKLKTILDSNIITNALVMVTSQNSIGKFIRSVLLYNQAKFKLPINHFEGPLKAQGLAIQNNTIRLYKHSFI